MAERQRTEVKRPDLVGLDCFDGPPFRYVIDGGTVDVYRQVDVGQQGLMSHPADCMAKVIVVNTDDRPPQNGDSIKIALNQ